MDQLIFVEIRFRLNFSGQRSKGLIDRLERKFGFRDSEIETDRNRAILDHKSVSISLLSNGTV